MHFTYTADLCATELCQGDVLERTPEINSLLQMVHPHFHMKESNLFFMVLTQSCDLVPRSDGVCKAPYITIAPVRPIETVLSRKVAELQSPGIAATLPVLTDKSKTKLSEFLKRLYNNNESGFFFLEASGTMLPGDCCAYLSLSIAIKSSEHYEKCVQAKRLQLSDTFQAKLGWLVGQMYSRVGTDDWIHGDLIKKVQSTLEDVAIWIPDSSEKPLSKALLARELGAGAVNDTVIKDALRSIPSKKAELVKRIDTVLGKVLSQMLTAVPTANVDNISRAVLRSLENDAAFTSLTK